MEILDTKRGVIEIPAVCGKLPPIGACMHKDAFLHGVCILPQKHEGKCQMAEKFGSVRF